MIGAHSPSWCFPVGREESCWLPIQLWIKCCIEVASNYDIDRVEVIDSLFKLIHEGVLFVWWIGSRGIRIPNNVCFLVRGDIHYQEPSLFICYHLVDSMLEIPADESADPPWVGCSMTEKDGASPFSLPNVLPSIWFGAMTFLKETDIKLPTA